MDVPEPRPKAPGGPRVGRNDTCPCGSGRKYKLCCGAARRPAGSNASPITAPTGAAQAVIDRAANLLRAGRYEEAIAPLQNATRLLPYNPSVLSDLGLTYLRCRRPAEAIGWFKRSLALRPNFARTHNHLATALERTGDEEAALAAYRRAVALNPKLAEAHNRIAALMLVKGKRREAAEAYDRASAAAGGTSFGHLCRVNALMARDQMNEAEDRLRRLIAREPANSEGHRLLGNLLAEGGGLTRRPRLSSGRSRWRRGTPAAITVSYYRGGLLGRTARWSRACWRGSKTAT